MKTFSLHSQLFYQWDKYKKYKNVNFRTLKKKFSDLNQKNKMERV